MEQIELKAIVREETGKILVKKLRSQGRIPGVVYHRGEKPVNITLADKELSRILHTSAGENVLINLKIEKDKKAKGRPVIIKEVQHDPVKRNILHVDFNEISLTDKIIVEVEVVPAGEAYGVKTEKGMLDHPVRHIKVQCLPTDIPPHIDVDVTGLKLNQSIHVRDLQLSEKLKVLTDPDILLFQVKLHEEKVEDETATETPELEVIREKKVEEGAETKEEPKAAKEASKDKEKK